MMMPCGCQVILMTDWSTLDTFEEAKYCSLHANTPEILTLLQEANQIIATVLADHDQRRCLNSTSSDSWSHEARTWQQRINHLLLMGEKP